MYYLFTRWAPFPYYHIFYVVYLLFPRWAPFPGPKRWLFFLPSLTSLTATVRTVTIAKSNNGCNHLTNAMSSDIVLRLWHPSLSWGTSRGHWRAIQVEEQFLKILSSSCFNESFFSKGATGKGTILKIFSSSCFNASFFTKGATLMRQKNYARNLTSF